MSTITATVAHPNLYLSVKGKLQKMEVGTELTVTHEQAKSLGKKLTITKQARKVDVSQNKPKNK